jgi:hypothetical protein
MPLWGVALATLVSTGGIADWYRASGEIALAGEDKLAHHICRQHLQCCTLSASYIQLGLCYLGQLQIFA